MEDATQHLANQFFFFLKDLAHRHYHHNHIADRTGVTYPEEDDEQWRRETAYSLTRMTLQARRRNNIHKYKNALGMLAYADTFQKHIAYWRYTKSSLEKKSTKLRSSFIPYDFEAVRSSMESSLRTLEWKSQRTYTNIALVVALYFGFISALGVATAIFKEQFESVELTWFWKPILVVSNQPLLLFVIPFLCFSVLQFVNGVYNFGLNAFYRWISRLVLAFYGSFPRESNQQYSVYLLFIISLAAFVFNTLLLWHTLMSFLS